MTDHQKILMIVGAMSIAHSLLLIATIVSVWRAHAILNRHFLKFASSIIHVVKVQAEATMALKKSGSIESLKDLTLALDRQAGEVAKLVAEVKSRII